MSCVVTKYFSLSEIGKMVIVHIITHTNFLISYQVLCDFFFFYKSTKRAMYVNRQQLLHMEKKTNLYHITGTKL